MGFCSLLKGIQGPVIVYILSCVVHSCVICNYTISPYFYLYLFTGDPKGVMISHRNMVANMSSVIYSIKVTSYKICIFQIPYIYYLQFFVTEIDFF